MLRVRRVKRALRRWATRPVVIPGWMLTAKYVGFIALGFVVYMATSPSIVESIGTWLSPIWAVTVMIVGAFGAWGSVSERFEPIERWACFILALLLLLYAFSPVALVITEADWDRASYSVTALLLSGLPISRAIYLLSRTGVDTHSGPVTLPEERP